MLFKSNTFVVGENPVDYHVMLVGVAGHNTTNETFLDTRVENGADLDDILLVPTYPDSNYSIYIKWYLAVAVKTAWGILSRGALSSSVTPRARRRSPGLRAATGG